MPSVLNDSKFIMSFQSLMGWTEYLLAMTGMDKSPENIQKVHDQSCDPRQCCVFGKL